MTDITGMFGGKPFTPPPHVEPDPPEVQLANAMSQHGFTPPKHIVLDGKIHRFDIDKKNDKRGWYIAHADGLPAGSYGDWRDGSSITWRADIGRELTHLEEMQYANKMHAIRAERERQMEQRRDVAATTAEAIWNGAQPAPADHPYLVRKGIQPHQARVTSDGRLLLPLIDANNALRSVQYIAEDGTKRFHSGGETGGCYDVVWDVEDRSLIYIAEGFATAATIHEVTGKPCAVAYSASNIPDVAEVIRTKMQGRIIIVADNDEGGVGEKYANIAAGRVGGQVITMPQEGDANDFHQAGGDLAELLEPAQNDWLVSAEDFAREPAPISWLVKHWLPKNCLAMVHGPPAAGKSFLALDMALHMAANAGSWNGHRSATGGCHVYLCGEGHHGMRSRVAAWKQHYQADRLNLYISKSGCDMNTPEGYAKVADALMSLPEPPLSVTVDTVHRFYAGDENNAQDVRSMIIACDQLRETFGCAVVLVHHTGVSEEAQHRARGSSAWRGALDVEVSVVPGKDGGPMEVIQRKQKDAEMAPPLAFRFETVEINGWLDEDGEQVSSVVLKRTEPPAKTQAADATTSSMKILRRHWEKSGKETSSDGRPYLTRSALVDGLIKEGNKETTAEKKVQPSGPLIGDLLKSGSIEAHEHGWVVTDPVWAANWMLGKLGA